MKKVRIKCIAMIMMIIMLLPSILIPVGAVWTGTRSSKTYTTYNLSDTGFKKTVPNKYAAGTGYNCTAMQGLNVGTTYAYTAKIHKDGGHAVVTRTTIDSGAQAVMNYYPSINSSSATACTVLGHANDIVVCGRKENGSTVNYMYVSTCNKGKAITRLKINGTGMYLTGYFDTVKTTGGQIAVSSAKVACRSAGKIYFLIKSGLSFYYCAINDNDMGGSASAPKKVTCYKIFNIDTRNAIVSTNGSSFGTIDHLENWTNQGFGYSPDEGALYVPVYNQYGANGRENLIIVYKVGSYVSLSALSSQTTDITRTVYPCTLSFYIKGTGPDIFEIESCGFRTGQGSSGDKKLYFNTNACSSKEGLYYVNYNRNSKTLTPIIDSSATTYTVKYDANGGSNADSRQNFRMNPTNHIYGISTCLRLNTFKRTGYTFAGWYLSRQSDNKWLYIYNNGTHWYTPGDQPRGAYLALYEDSRRVSALTTVNGDIVTCHAQWKPNSTGTKAFYIQYNENGGSGAHIPDTKAVYGQNTKITSDSYSRPGYVFSGWIAHRRSDNSFIYKNSSSFSDAWLVPGDSETGYFLKAYNKGCTVKATSSINCDIITFYAAWTGIRNFTGPLTVSRGSSFGFNGTVESDAGIYKLVLTIKNPNGSVYDTVTVYPKSCTYNLSAINGHLSSMGLQKGKYTYTITATTMNSTSSVTNVLLRSSCFNAK